MFISSFYIKALFVNKGNFPCCHQAKMWADRADCYQAADVQSGRIGLPADGPQKAVHLLNGAELLLAVLLLWVFGDDGNFQASVCFTHRLHLRVLQQINAVVLQLLGAVCADERIEVSQNLQNKHRETCRSTTARRRESYSPALCLVSYAGLTNNEGCFGPQGGKNPRHLHGDVTSAHDHTASARENQAFQ